MERILFEREPLVSAQIVNPQVFRPWMFARRLAVEEENVRLDTLGIEDPRRQAKQGMYVPCASRRRRTVSPAPPSNNTLSGTTMAARPCCFRMVKTCWRKLSCLLLVLAQKSSR